MSPVFFFTARDFAVNNTVNRQDAKDSQEEKAGNEYFCFILGVLASWRRLSFFSTESRSHRNSEQEFTSTAASSGKALVPTAARLWRPAVAE